MGRPLAVPRRRGRRRETPLSHMNRIHQAERVTQNRVVQLLTRPLGYRSLGNWERRPGNAAIEEGLLRNWLRQRGTDESLVTRALTKLQDAAAIGGGRNLYDANKAVYGLLRYGVKVKADGADHTSTVWLVDWNDPEANDLAVAEEVTVHGHHEKRPDVVVYVNGIALAVLELKRSSVSVADGVRQNIINQQREFIEPFFAPVQLVLAGNDSEGLRYGTVGTTEPYYLTWKEERPGWTPDASPDTKYIPADECDGGANALDCALSRLLDPRRLLELVHDFVVFDAGTKKLARHNQYFGVRAAQTRVQRREGGILWHTQGSGKSLTMVWLARWIRETITDSRVLIVTDRVELDAQIEKVFTGVGEPIHRTTGGADLVATLNRPVPPLVCSLVHKFGPSEDESVAEFANAVRQAAGEGYSPKGDIYVFVDEAHRTQSGTLHEAMRALLPNAVFVGFTGTPILKDEKKRTHDRFGPFIHTYKFDEAVADGVIRDIRYEARDIDQNLGSKKRIDRRFERLIAREGLSDDDRARLTERWATLRKLYSSQERLQRIVSDILDDMDAKPRLRTGHGNAILVTSSVYEACKVYELFQDTELRGKCAVVTSYRPHVSDIKSQPTAEGQNEALLKYEIYRRMLADYFREPEDEAAGKTEAFEMAVKERFVETPGQMKLLIVVDKLLTGFDAPPATYLYIDKPMRNHGLFQAICRVNRLDGDDKDYGYVVDYRDLFNALASTIEDYTGGAFEAYDPDDVAGLLNKRLDHARQDLDQALEQVRALLDGVEPPRETTQILHYFCAREGADADELQANKARRDLLYKVVRALVRTYADLADEMPEAGYTAVEAAAVKQEVYQAEKTAEAVRVASDDRADTSYYDPHMRQLLDEFVRADDAEIVASFNDIGLVELIVERGIGAAEKVLPGGLRENADTIAETIENNVRRVIIEKRSTNPKYYEDLSDQLDALIEARRERAEEFAAYLQQLEALTRQAARPEESKDYPDAMNTSALRALYDNLDRDEALASGVHAAIHSARLDGWRGHAVKEKKVLYAIEDALGNHAERAPAVFAIAETQREY